MPTPDRSVLLAQLQRLPYFSGLPSGTLQGLVDLATWHEYRPGAVVFLEGETNAGLYSVQSGWIKVVKFALDGREQVLRYFGPGEAFSEIGLFLARPNPATAVALEQSGIWRLHRTHLQPLLVARPDLLLHVMGNMADRIAYLADMVADLSLRTVEVRLARLLIDEASAGTLVRQSWLTQAELAARLGTVPEVLNRALRVLADAGIIQVDRRQITILDPPALAQRAQTAV